MPYFLVVEDLARASIGPFPSLEAAQAHYEWTKNVRGDGADLVEIRSAGHDPEAHLTMTAEEDKADKGEDFVS